MAAPFPDTIRVRREEEEDSEEEEEEKEEEEEDEDNDDDDDDDDELSFAGRLNLHSSIYSEQAQLSSSFLSHSLQTPKRQPIPVSTAAPLVFAFARWAPARLAVRRSRGWPRPAA